MKCLLRVLPAAERHVKLDIAQGNDLIGQDRLLGFWARGLLGWGDYSKLKRFQRLWLLVVLWLFVAAVRLAGIKA